MFDASLPSEFSADASVHGRATVRFENFAGQTRLKHVYHTDPLRIVFPTPGSGDIAQAIVATTSGGLVGGDLLEMDFAAGENAFAQLTPQAAEKVYRSTGADSQISVDLDAAPGAWLEWLPQETILFDGARLRRRTRARVAPGAVFFAGEMLVFGRRAHGESLTTGLIHDAWEVHRDATLVWADRFHVEDRMTAILGHPAGLDGAAATATAVYVADDAPERLALARELLTPDSDGIRAGATAVNGVLVIRWLARDAQVMRRAFGEFWGAFRHQVAGLPAVLPRIWHI